MQWQSPFLRKKAWILLKIHSRNHCYSTIQIIPWVLFQTITKEVVGGIVCAFLCSTSCDNTDLHPHYSYIYLLHLHCEKKTKRRTSSVPFLRYTITANWRAIKKANDQHCVSFDPCCQSIMRTPQVGHFATLKVEQRTSWVHSVDWEQTKNSGCVKLRSYSETQVCVPGVWTCKDLMNNCCYFRSIS